MLNVPPPRKFSVFASGVRNESLMCCAALKTD